MRSPSLKPGSGRVIVALLGLIFLKALGELAGVSPTSRGRSAEAVIEQQDVSPAAEVLPADNHATLPKSDQSTPDR